MRNENFTAKLQHKVIRKDGIPYLLSNQTTTYQEAEATCESHGGKLAQISNQEERQFLEPHLRQHYFPGDVIFSVQTLSLVDFFFA